MIDFEFRRYRIEAEFLAGEAEFLEGGFEPDSVDPEIPPQDRGDPYTAPRTIPQHGGEALANFGLFQVLPDSAPYRCFGDSMMVHEETGEEDWELLESAYRRRFWD